MKRLAESFLISLKAQVTAERTSYKKFITENTFIGGQNFSFKDHEFQEYILDVIESNPGKIFSVSKPSQIGLSEVFNRLILAIAAVKPGTGILVSFPSITFSQEVFKTRIASVINSSPALSSLIDRNNDSASVKSFLNGSIMYALGGSKKSNTALLNRPVAAVLCDETDKQDMDIMSGYATRMVHTPEKDRLILNVSTPTVDGIGINALIKQCGELHTPWIGCPCGHEFIPDYYENVVVPGYNDALTLLTREKAAELNLDDSYLECPECKGKIDKSNYSVIWKITYNIKGTKDEIGIEMNPFAAMGFRSVPAIVKDSIRMTSVSEFVNQCLGKVADRSSTTISVADITFNHEPDEGGQNIFGLDLGKECYWMRGRQRSDTTTHVVEAQVVKLTELEEFLKEQHQKYVFAAGVIDSQPYSDLVYRLIKRYPRMFSAIYVSPNPPKPWMYEIKVLDKMNEVVRQITINKGLAMDAFAGSIKDFYTFESSPLDATIAKHFTDMRRVRDYRFDEMIYKWTKSSKGSDHFWHTAIYLFMAGKLAFAGINTAYSIPIIIGKMNVDARRAELRRRG